MEVPLLYIAAALGLVSAGYGAYSLDAWLGIADVWPAPVRALIVAGGILGGFTMVGLRRRPSAPAGA